MSAGLAPVDEIAVMPLIDICRLVTEEYEMVYISDEDIGLVKKEDMETYRSIIHEISR